jgi:hypothetical protein
VCHRPLGKAFLFISYFHLIKKIFSLGKKSLLFPFENRLSLSKHTSHSYLVPLSSYKLQNLSRNTLELDERSEKWVNGREDGFSLDI